MNIGIFWIYKDNIFSKKEALNDIQEINGFKDSDLSHYEVWEEMKITYPYLYLYEYEEIPRGRVVWDVHNQQTIIYCNRALMNDEVAKVLIMREFKLESSYVFLYDEHYEIVARVY